MNFQYKGRFLKKPRNYIYYMVMVFNIQYFSYIMMVSFIGRGNQSTGRKPLTCRKLQTNFIIQCCIKYTSPSVGFKLAMLVVIGTDCIGSYKSNYHMITTMTAPLHNDRSPLLGIILCIIPFKVVLEVDFFTLINDF
jgi:hypothetical protein